MIYHKYGSKVLFSLPRFIPARLTYILRQGGYALFLITSTTGIDHRAVAKPLGSIQSEHTKITVHQGQDASFTFFTTFSSQPREFIFGLWEKGYVSRYLMTVSGSGVYHNNKHPDHSLITRISYVEDENKQWSIGHKKFTFILHNVRESDSREYGGQLDINGFGSTIHSRCELNVIPGPYLVANPDFTVSQVGFPSIFRYQLDLEGLPGSQEPSGNITFSSLEKNGTKIPLFQSLWYGYGMVANKSALSSEFFPIQYNETSEDLKIIMKNTTKTDFGKIFELDLSIRNVNYPLHAQVQLFQYGDCRIPDMRTVTNVKVVHKVQEKVVTKTVTIKAPSQTSNLHPDLSLIILTVMSWFLR